ncbi:uncharacterized protein LOC141617873 [Silene latifolia]|uniref:uncharacterized protein LOC141617873 n=1 Tax=Silene latifolia TaxID=37657 RepID=UPI003D77827E
MEKSSRKQSTSKKDERYRPYGRGVNRVDNREENHQLPTLAEYGFSTSVGGILKALREMGDRVRWPRPLVEEQAWRKDSKKKCEFHRDIGHNTKDCHTLRREIRRLYEQGELSHLLPSAKRRATETKGDRPETSCRISHSDLPAVAFDDGDIRAEQDRHDALIITLSMANYTIRKVLVNTGRSANMDCFAWSHDDMIGIDPFIITHKLSVDPKYKPIQHGRRKFAAERNKVINQEVDSLIAANKIREVKYPDWLSNIVVVPKKNGKWRVCVDFTDLNKIILDILRKRQKFEWTAEHEKAFRELKHYVSTPPLLSKSEQGEPLYLYLAVTEVAVSAVLVREQDMEQKPVYYVSKSLLPAETRYRSLEMYDPRTAIKSQPLADFVSDFSPAIQNLADKEILTLKGSREAEEALILGIQLVLELGVRNLQISSDSLLTVSHVNDEFIARDLKMIAYLKVAKELKQKLKDCKIKQIPRDQNVEADALATLGATFKPTKLSSIPIAHMLEPSIQKLEEVDRGELEDQ